MQPTPNTRSGRNWQRRLPLWRDLSAATRSVTLLVLALLLLSLTQRGRAASTDAPLDQDQAIWRAASRLGYAPTPDRIAAIRKHPGGAQGWALDEVDRAYAASRVAPVIPATLAQFNQPLPVIFEEYKKEREARKSIRKVLPKEAGMQARALMPVQDRFAREVSQEAAAWRLATCANPALENPLLSRMTEFWFNHLNVSAGKGAVRPYVGHYVVNAIRPNVFGRFDDLLLASARHPAMLFYLDQVRSVADGKGAPDGRKRGLNENYARELMELHTLGVNGGYTQTDVREMARILTGWTVDPQAADGFRFVARLHDAGSKVLLKKTFSNDGESEGRAAIAMLAQHPATAQRIARRLAQFFITDQPGDALVARIAGAFTGSRGDLRVTMRAVVSAPEFWLAGNTLFKTPLDYACSALSVMAQSEGTAAERPDIRASLQFLSSAGQPMHAWQTPDGYKTDAATWMAPEALTRRADYAFTIARAGNAAAPPTFLAPFLSPATRERIAREPVQTQTALMLASPEFMRK